MITTLIFRSLVVLGLVFSAGASAAPIQSYVWSVTGNWIAEIGQRFYQGEVNLGADMWGLDGANNTIYSSRTGSWIPLNTTLFTVNDILDVTYTGGSNRDNVYFRTTSGNYVWNVTGNWIAEIGLRFYQGEVNLGADVWGLDGANNTIYSSRTGNWIPLNTTLFTVNDILDVTYTGGSNLDNVYFRTTNGNYVWNVTGDWIAEIGLRFYQGDVNLGADVWGLDGASNTIYSSRTGTWTPLNSTLFTVNDILDVTYTGGSNRDMYFIVQVPETVPEPVTYALLFVGLGTLVFTNWRRPRRKV